MHTDSASRGGNLADGTTGQMAMILENHHEKLYHEASIGATRARKHTQTTRPDKLEVIPYSATDANGAKRRGVLFRLRDGHRRLKLGSLSERGIFQKFMAASHFLRYPPAIALQASLVDELERRECAVLDIKSDSGERYMVPFATFIARGFAIDRGHGFQVALELFHWQKGGRA